MRKAIAATLILAFAMAVPGSTSPAQAAAKNLIRIATLAPRNTDLTPGFTKLDQGLKSATKDQWGIRLYPSAMRPGPRFAVNTRMITASMTSRRKRTSSCSFLTTPRYWPIVRSVSRAGVHSREALISSFPSFPRKRESRTSLDYKRLIPGLRDASIETPTELHDGLPEPFGFWSRPK